MILSGPMARVVILFCAVFGFLLAMGDVLDIYDALWRYTVPATLAYGALIWRFALATPKGEEPLSGRASRGAFARKLVMTVLVILATLGVIALVWDIYVLVADNWPYVVLALVVMAAICVWALLAGDKRAAPGSK